MQVALAIENKVALVIGNANYKDAKLKNSVNDARDMRDALKKVGFDVVYVENATNEQMGAVRDEFLDKLNKDSVALFYYAGHGVQSDGSNYLIPIDAKIKTKSDLQYQSKDVGFFLGAMEDAGNETNIVILDACRNNPFRGVRAISGGLTSPTNTPTGSIIAYATAPGKVTDDNRSGNNGLYTSYLKQYLFEPGLTIEAALKKVSKSVKKDNSEQVPWYNTSMDEDLCLAGCEGSKPPVVQTNYAPLLSFVSGANAVNQNKAYSVKFKGTDADGDLSKILIDWGDGTAITSKTAKQNTSVSFSHTYKFAGIYDLIATAIDKQNVESETLSKEIQVKDVS
jgi:uncharacterized caspase-like protein